MKRAGGLVEGGGSCPAGEQTDHPLDLAPAAIVDDVAERAATMRPARGLAGGIIAEPAHEIVRVGDRGAVG